jgi:hypothetical protein
MDFGKYVVQLLGLAVFGYIGCQGIDLIKNNSPHIATIGSSDKIAKSDRAEFYITIDNETDVIKDIADKRDSDRKEVIDFLIKAGFKKEDIDSESSSVSDLHKGSENIAWKKKYSVTDTIIIKTDDVDLVDKVRDTITQLVNKGINLCARSLYFCKDIDKLRIEMIEEATNDARVRAEHIAKCSGEKLGGLRNFSTGKFAVCSDITPVISDYDWRDEYSKNKLVRVTVYASFYLE